MPYADNAAPASPPRSGHLARKQTGPIRGRVHPRAAPKRIRELVALMTTGPDDGTDGPLDIREAAARMGIAVQTAARYLKHPEARKAYNETVHVLRESARARNLHVATEIRDKSPNHMARMSAIKWLEPNERSAGTTVNVTTNVSAGYVIDLTRDRGGPVMDHQAHAATIDLEPEEDVGSDGDPTL